MFVSGLADRQPAELNVPAGCRPARALPRKSLRDSIRRQRHRFRLSLVTCHFASHIAFLTGTA
jgi:hypothetical protein